MTLSEIGVAHNITIIIIIIIIIIYLLLSLVVVILLWLYTQESKYETFLVWLVWRRPQETVHHTWCLISSISVSRRRTSAGFTYKLAISDASVNQTTHVGHMNFR